MSRGEILWEPGPLDASAAGRFARSKGFTSYAELHRWSVTDLSAFWAAVAESTGVLWRELPTETLEDRVMPGARWFPGGQLSYSEHALVAAAARPHDIAVVAHSQTRAVIELTWAELASSVAACAAGFRRLGVTRGDRVAAYAPNIPETLVAFLAAASIGAVWSSCAPEFGAASVLDRLSQIEPVVLLAIDGYRYGDKVVDRTAEVAELRRGLPSVRHIVSIRYVGLGDDGWSALLAGEHGEIEHEAVPFDHPLYILYSSGTTGLPKPIVHGHGGITVEHLKALILHQDLGPMDRFFWFTTTGWMMWNYLVSGLLCGSTIVLFDGDPAQADLRVLWEVASESGATVFGTSAPFLMACLKAGVQPERGAIRWVGSTGAPLPADGFRWVASSLGVPVSSISGGTDVCSAFVGSSPLVPVRAGEISCRLLGCAVEAFDEGGHPNGPGTTGELVITEPMPSMPVGFWGDDGGTRYRSAYFDRFPGVWCHGDWITFTDDGACTITGRSDATLNRGGVRLGTSDFYAVVESLPDVADSLVVHIEDDAGGPGTLRLFVALVPGAELDEALRQTITSRLRTELSPRHVPDTVEQVRVVPRTLSGKKLELPVKRVLTGTPVALAAATGALGDPTSLDQFLDLRGGP